MNISITLSNIHNLCTANKISIDKMLKECGLSKSVIDNMKREKPSIPAADKICAIANYFGVTSDYLLGLDDVPNRKSQSSELSEDKQRLLDMYDKLVDIDKGRVLGSIEEMLKSEKYTSINSHSTTIYRAARSTDNHPSEIVETEKDFSKFPTTENQKL